MTIRRWDPLRDLLTPPGADEPALRGEPGRARATDPGRARLERLDARWPTSTRRPRRFVVLLELPGLSADDVEIHVDADQLVVRGERRPSGQDAARELPPHGAQLRRLLAHLPAHRRGGPGPGHGAVPGRPPAARAPEACAARLGRRRGRGRRREARVLLAVAVVASLAVGVAVGPAAGRRTRPATRAAEPRRRAGRRPLAAPSAAPTSARSRAGRRRRS